MVETLCGPDEVSAFLRDLKGPVRVEALGGHASFRLKSDCQRALRYRASGLVELSPADQVAVFHAGTTLAEASGELEAQGQTLPFDSVAVGSGATLGGAVSMNLPNRYGGTCGSWRDWVLGLTVVLANGDVVKCGSKVVKDVAGYGLHKVFIGARGTLGLLTEVVLRTSPMARFEPIRARVTAEASEAWWIQRTRRTDFEAACSSAGTSLAAQDPGSSTLWAATGAELKRFDCDWVLRSGAGSKNLQIDGAAERDLMIRTKKRLDPDGKLNPGEFGFL